MAGKLFTKEEDYLKAIQSDREMPDDIFRRQKRRLPLPGRNFGGCPPPKTPDFGRKTEAAKCSLVPPAFSDTVLWCSSSVAFSNRPSRTL